MLLSGFRSWPIKRTPITRTGGFFPKNVFSRFLWIPINIKQPFLPRSGSRTFCCIMGKLLNASIEYFEQIFFDLCIRTSLLVLRTLRVRYPKFQISSSRRTIWHASSSVHTSGKKKTSLRCLGCTSELKCFTTYTEFWILQGQYSRLGFLTSLTTCPVWSACLEWIHSSWHQRT